MPKGRISSRQNSRHSDNEVRLFVYRFLIRTGRAPLVAEIARVMATSHQAARAALARLSESHAFMMQDNRELWRVAPFSAVPTAFPVRVGKHSYLGNCIWDALGIPAMLNKDAYVGACCGCCNLQMTLHVRRGKLLEKAGLIHIAVPARDWYKDVVFT
jgi:Alkylmercury lyase